MSKAVEKSSDEELKSKLQKIEAKIKGLTTKKGVIQDEFYRRSFLRPPKKTILIAVLSIIILYAVFLRVWHLFDVNYYYIVSADSYIFQRMAELVVTGHPAFPVPEAPYIQSIGGTGLTYPLAYCAYIIAFFSQTSASDALVLAGEILPIVLTIATTLLLFFMVTKTHNWIVGVGAAFAMAVIPSIYFIQAAGYLDRDGLSLLLIMAGGFAFYISRNLHFKRGKWEIGWIISALIVLSIESLLYLEWNFGPLLMIVILTGCVIMEFIGHFLQSFLKGYSLRRFFFLIRDLEFIASALKGVPKRFINALKQLHWKPFLLIILVNALLVLASPDFLIKVQKSIDVLFAAGTSYVGEAQGLFEGSGIGGLLGYNILLIPMLLGFIAALKKRREGDIFWLGWLFTTFFLSLFAVRSLIYMAPAACVLIGRALAPISRFRSLGLRGKTVLVLFMIITIFFTVAAYSIAEPYSAASNNSMTDALIWCKQNTQSNAIIMTWWDYGYWIIDIAHRTPVFDNSAQSPEQMTDVAWAYCSNDTNTTIQIMNKYGASYLIFSKNQVVILPFLSKLAFGQSYGDGVSVPDNMKNSVYNRVFDNNFTSEYGLTKVYGTPQNQPEVVVLKLENT